VHSSLHKSFKQGSSLNSVAWLETSWSAFGADSLD